MLATNSVDFGRYHPWHAPSAWAMFPKSLGGHLPQVHVMIMFIPWAMSMVYMLADNWHYGHNMWKFFAVGIMLAILLGGVLKTVQDRLCPPGWMCGGRVSLGPSSNAYFTSMGDMIGFGSSIVFDPILPIFRQMKIQFFPSYLGCATRACTTMSPIARQYAFLTFTCNLSKS